MPLTSKAGRESTNAFRGCEAAMDERQGGNYFSNCSFDIFKHNKAMKSQSIDGQHDGILELCNLQKFVLTTRNVADWKQSSLNKT